MALDFFQLLEPGLFQMEVTLKKKIDFFEIMLFYTLERQSMTINQKLMGSIISEIFALKQSDAKLDSFNLQFGTLIVCFCARGSLLSFNCVDSGHHGEFSRTDIVSLSSIALTKG